jgi:hypothetical protein
MHDENKGMWCSLCAEHTLCEENWTLSVMENMTCSNEGSLPIQYTQGHSVVDHLQRRTACHV